MEISTSVESHKATVRLAGKLTVNTVPDLSAAFDSLSLGVCDLDIDLTDMDYISSAGLRVLVTVDKRVVKRGGIMRLLHPSEEIQGVLEMTGLSELFAIER